MSSRKLPATVATHYAGARHGSTGRVRGVVVARHCGDGTQPLNPRFDLWNHSPDGFEWGYCGSGPAQLALALLADATGNDETALGLYQSFKSDYIARLTQATWSLRREDILAWVEAHRTELADRLRRDGRDEPELFEPIDAEADDDDSGVDLGAEADLVDLYDEDGKQRAVRIGRGLAQAMIERFPGWQVRERA